jgi:hypothetical protein
MVKIITSSPIKGYAGQTRAYPKTAPKQNKQKPNTKFQKMFIVLSFWNYSSFSAFIVKHRIELEGAEGTWRFPKLKKGHFTHR